MDIVSSVSGIGAANRNEKLSSIPFSLYLPHRAHQRSPWKMYLHVTLSYILIFRLTSMEIYAVMYGYTCFFEAAEHGVLSWKLHYVVLGLRHTSILSVWAAYRAVKSVAGTENAPDVANHPSAYRASIGVVS